MTIVCIGVCGLSIECVKCGQAKEQDGYYYRRADKKHDRTCKQCRNSRPQQPSKQCVDCGTGTWAERCKPCSGEARRKNYQCSVDGCERKRHCKGFCSTHYYHHQRENELRFILTCDQCGTQYKYHRGPRGKSYCSDACKTASQMPVMNGPEIRAKQIEAYRKHVQENRGTSSTALDIYREYPDLKAGYEGLAILRAKDQQQVWRSRRSPLRAAFEDHDYPAFTQALKAKASITPQGCWEWQRRNKDGYPAITIKGQNIGVHRMVLEAKHGKPLGSQAAHHKCANTMCVNPDHLQPVTHAENMAEMLARHSYLRRINELEAALSELKPDHPLLNTIEVA